MNYCIFWIVAVLKYKSVAFVGRYANLLPGPILAMCVCLCSCMSLILFSYKGGRMQALSYASKSDQAGFSEWMSFLLISNALSIHRKLNDFFFQNLGQ